MQNKTLAAEYLLSQNNCLPTQTYISGVIIYLRTDFKIQTFVKQECNM
jgi:hypothetical protein